MSKRDQRGVTLIELIIAISVFSVVMVVALDTFMKVLKFNREAVQKQGVQDHAEFLFSLMSKEIRMARINYEDKCKDFFSSFEPPTTIAANHTYAALDADGNGDYEGLRFQNYEGLCVYYYQDYDTANNIDRLRVVRYNPADGTDNRAWVLPKDIKVSNLHFVVTNLITGQVGLHQPPSVAYYLKLSSNIWEPPQISFSNFIVGRNIEQF